MCVDPTLAQSVALSPYLDHVELGDAILLHTHRHGDAVLLNKHGESQTDRKEGED